VRESQATWKLVKRSVKMGDLLTITASGFSEEKEFAKVDSGEFLVEAGSMNPVPGFAEKLKGVKQGQSKEFTLDIPQDYPNGEFAGKKAHFNVSVSDVKKKTLPNLTNAFVASLGDDIKTVAELRGRITDNLEKQAADGLRRSLEEKVIDALVGDAEFEVSPMIIEHEAEHVLEDQQRQLAQYNIDFQQYIDGLGKSNEEIVLEAKNSAELRLKRMLVVDRLVEDGGVTITPEQVAAETEIMQNQPQYEQENLDSDEARDAIQKVLQRRAAIDQVIAIIHKPKTAKSKTKADGKKKNDK
jgi:trigger factor